MIAARAVRLPATEAMGCGIVMFGSHRRQMVSTGWTMASHDRNQGDVGFACDREAAARSSL